MSDRPDEIMQSQSSITLGEPRQSDGPPQSQKEHQSDTPDGPPPKPTQTNNDSAPRAKTKENDNKFKRRMKGVLYGILGVVAFPLFFCALLCGMDYNNGGFPENSLWKRFTRVVTLKKLRDRVKRQHA